MSDITPLWGEDISKICSVLLNASPCNATGNVGDAAASNTKLTSDDVVEVSDSTAGSTEAFVCKIHPNLLDLLCVKLGRTIPISEVPPGRFLRKVLVLYNSLYLWCWLLERGTGGCIEDAILSLETKGYGCPVLHDRDCDSAVPGNH